MSKNEQRDFQQWLQQIEGLVQRLNAIADPDVQAMSKELMQSLLDLYGVSLERMLDILFEASGQVLIDELARDELVSHMLLLHGLHPFSLDERVRQALDKVRPYMRSHGGNVELLGISKEGDVRLRLEGSCHSCPSSRVTLKYAVEEAIYAIAPDVTSIETEGVIEPQPDRSFGFIPISDLQAVPAIEPIGAKAWTEVDDLSSIKEGALRVLDIAGLPILFSRVDDRLYAYGNACPKCGQLLGQAKLLGEHLTCTECGYRYDIVRAGRGLTDPQLHLDPIPLLMEDDRVRIALPAALA